MVTHDRNNTIRISQVCNEIFSKTKFKRWELFYKLVIGKYNPFRINTFYVLCIFGMGGVLIDLDHFIIKELQMLRPLHLPYWLIIGFICICYYAYANRRIHKSSIDHKTSIIHNDRMPR